MSSTDLIKFVAEENHVKFRSTLNNLLYSKLSEGISEKTFETLSGIFASDIMEGKKPDFLDIDKDGNKKESMKKAAADKDKEKKVEESILSMTNLWKAYKG